jgi:putative membrane protein
MIYLLMETDLETKNKKRGSFWIRTAKGGTFGLGMIPGVSSATLAYIAGIFDEFVEALANVKKEFKKSMGVILPVLLGALIAAGISMVVFVFGYGYAPLAFTGAFAGVILGSLPLILYELKGTKRDGKFWTLLIVSFLIAAGIGALSFTMHFTSTFDLSDSFERGEWWTYFAVFFCGFVSAATTIIPGISGAMALFVMGLYTPMLGLFIGSNSILSDWSKWPQVLGALLCMIVGMVVGILSTSKGINYALKKHRGLTFVVALGFILGSVVSMFMNDDIFKIVQTSDNGAFVEMSIYEAAPIWEWIVFVIALLGFGALFYYFSRKSIKKKEAEIIDEIDTPQFN